MSLKEENIKKNEEQRKKQLEVASKIVDLLMNEDVTTNDALKALGFVISFLL